MTFDIQSLSGPCECGHEHRLQVKNILICHDALKILSDSLLGGELSGYRHPVILCDSNTRRAAAEPLEELMARVPVLELDPKGLHATNEKVQEIADWIGTLNEAPDVILAVGSGSVHDLSRYTAHARNIDFIACPTAASVDGFVSTVAAMTWYGMKKTMPAVAPAYVYADTAVIAKAPGRLNASGIADLLGKYTAIADWKIIHAVTGEYICDRVCRMEYDAIRDVMDSVQEINEGGEEACGKLMYALLLSGLAMQMVGNSRPASCAEHHCSHFWEMDVLNPEIDAYHGEKVGVGLRIVTRKYKKIAEALRSGNYRVEPWQGLELDKIRASYGKVGLYDAIMEENTPDPMKDITAGQVEEHIPEILSILDTCLPSEAEIVRMLHAGHCPATMEEIGLSEDKIEPTLELSPYVRRRLSFNRLCKMIRC